MNQTRKNKTKILYLVTKSNWGGAQRYVFDLAVHFAQQPQTEVVVAVGGQGELTRKLKEKKIQTFVMLELGRDIKIIGDFISFIKILKLLANEKPDVLHLNSSKIGLMGAVAGRIMNVKKIIFTAHGWVFSEERPLPLRTLLKFLQWLTVLATHKTIAVSHATKKEIADMPFISSKISVIHNGIDNIAFKTRVEARKELSEGHNIPAQPLWMGTIGELHKNKGLVYAINAIAELAKTQPSPRHKDLTFVFVIIGEGEERGNLEKQIKARGLENVVFLLGKIENASLYLKAFDIFLLPSIKEGLPYVILEAGKAGLPVIASDIGGIPEAIEHRVSGILTKPGDTKEIVSALKTFGAQEKQRKYYSNNLQKRLGSGFLAQKMYEQTFSHYA